MSKIPPPTETTVTRIYKAYEDNEKPRFSRRLGASIIGKPCDREIAYSFFWAKFPKWQGRMLRLFQTGNISEAKSISDLKRIGVNVQALDPDTGKQFEFEGIYGHMVCKLDGALLGIVEAPNKWHVLEAKSASEKAYNLVIKHGCEKAKPEHYAQCQVNMGFSEMDRCVYMVENKNTDDLYIERIKFDSLAFKRLMQRAKEIIFGKEPAIKISESPAWYQCSFCHFKSICHNLGDCANRNCRTCQFSQPLEQDCGLWGCDKHSNIIDEETQKQGCDGHQYKDWMISNDIAPAIKTLQGRIISDP